MVFVHPPQRLLALLKASARVESLLASTTLQDKPAWARGKAKQVPHCI